MPNNLVKILLFYFTLCYQPFFSILPTLIEGILVQIVPLEEVESLEKTPAKGVPLPLEGGRRVAKLLSAQSGVGGHQEDQLGDILVLPVHRNISSSGFNFILFLVFNVKKLLGRVKQ